ncbi:helix-turn-helix domain-containing protein [Leifsonia virtsii]|uniref:Helix-turn-helix transcriptional regulator n=1 Tax=Leifsonia virtsii TaxID=3035915 RepID=A0ABT8J313_9MICO|nr:helix-turn-helix transcriptional regulator [Leifsonia virtsii]MDN4599470.1 helix-turn-helix transcriptional regulator [Leifsonia virtsii]
MEGESSGTGARPELPGAVRAADELLELVERGTTRIPPLLLQHVALFDPASVPRSRGAASRRLTAAVIVALTRLGRLDAAVEQARRELGAVGALLEGRGVESAEAVLWSAVAEAFASAGWSREGASAALRALDIADGGWVAGRARALLAVCRAMNGEYVGAERVIREGGIADDVTRGDAEATVNDYPFFLAAILVASAAFDGARLRSLSARVRSIDPEDETMEVTARAAEAMALLVEGRLDQAAAAVAAITHGTAVDQRQYMVRGFALGMQADILLARGDPRRALRLLEGVDSTGSHSLCFDMQRASAHLQLGQEREALAATAGCIRVGAEHCLRTLPPILLRRAIALERLGHEARADAAFAEAFHHILSSGSATPLLTLPRAETLRLLHRLREANPDLAAQAAEIAARVEAVPRDPEEPPSLPRLSPREQALAERLRSGATLTQIAQDGHVSINTIKSQARSLYAKLGVSGRDEAVSLLERRGYF